LHPTFKPPNLSGFRAAARTPPSFFTAKMVKRPILGAFRKRKRPFFFIQIGAFDGQTSDPIHSWIRKERWQGIFVEPQPEPFQALRKNYGSSLN
jgi:hypothetical protein